MSLRSAVADADRQLDKHWDELRIYVKNVSFCQTRLSAAPVRPLGLPLTLSRCKVSVKLSHERGDVRK